MQTKLGILAISALFTLYACGAPEPSNKVKPEPVAAKVDGEAVFTKSCVVCHGPDGKLGLSGAKDLSVSILTKEERVEQVTNGKNLMTPFKGILTPEEIDAVVEYTFTLKK